MSDARSATPEGTTLVSSVVYSLVYDTLDSRKDPHDGFYTKFTQEFAGVGGDVTFLRTTGSARYYHELLPDRDVVGLVKVQGGDIFGLGEDVRLLDDFFKGGETVRGFESSGIGPRDVSTGRRARRQDLLSPERRRCSSRCRCCRAIRLQGRRLRRRRHAVRTPTIRAGAISARPVMLDGRRDDPLVGRRLAHLGFAARTAPRRLRLCADQGRLRQDAVVPLQRRHAASDGAEPGRGDPRPVPSGSGAMHDTRFFPRARVRRCAEVAALVGAELVRGDPDRVDRRRRAARDAPARAS